MVMGGHESEQTAGGPDEATSCPFHLRVAADGLRGIDAVLG
jgi:hypothetical protein